MKIYFILLLLLLLNTSCQQVMDSSDKAALKKHFEIPDDAEMIAYDGFPPMAGFGQREGLSISSKYKLNDEDKQLDKKHAEQRTKKTANTNRMQK